MQSILGQLFAFFTAICWAQNSLVYSAAGKRVGSSTVTHIRLWIALPAMILLHFIFTGVFFPGGIPPASAVYLLISGFMGFCLADLFIFRAFVDIGPRETLVVLTMSPIFAAFISWAALHEVLSLLQIIGVAATIGGVVWVILVERKALQGSRVHHQKMGVLFAFLGAFSQAVGMVLAKQGLDGGVHPVSANLLRITAGLAGLVIYSLFRGRFTADFRKMADKKALLFITTGALIGPVLGIIFTLYALTMAPVGIVTTLMQTSPVLLLPIDRFVLKKKVPVGAFLGTVLAIGGAAVLFIF